MRTGTRSAAIAFGLWIALSGAFPLVATGGNPAQDEAFRKAAAEYFEKTPENNYYLQPDDVLNRIKSGKNDFVLVDVRSEKEFRQWHLPGAIGIPYRDIADPTNLAKLPKDKDIILYCNSGHEESKALPVLGMLGYRAYGLKWGLMGWRTVPSTGAVLKAVSGSLEGKYPTE